MRVLMVTSTFPRWQGDTVPPFVHALSVGLAARGHEVHVLAPHTAGAAMEERMDGLYVHRFRYAPSRLEALCYGGGITENLKRRRSLWLTVPPFLAAEYAALIRLVRQHRIDLVHAHWVLPQGLVAAWAKPRLGARVVVSAHGADVFAVRGRLRRRFLRFAVSRADACTSNSTAMQSELRRLTGVDSTVIPMGVDISRFTAGAERDGCRPGSSPRVLFVGRLAEKKGVRYLVEAMPIVRACLPDARLIVVGDGPERSALRAMADQCGLNGSVEFVGAVENSALPDYYRDADVFVAPSVRSRDGDTEGLGVVLLEAAACGLPIVASNIGGIPDIVRHGETGLLVEPGKPQALATAILKMLMDRRLREQVSGNARGLVEERFTWNSVVDRFHDLYCRIASGA